MQTGEPYIFFIDTANNALPDFLKKQGLKIHGSNVCTEITLPTSKDRTAVCCLSSLNAVYYDEWKKEQLFIRDVLEMLDNVLTVFIEEAPPELKRAVESAKNERSVGIGLLGLHSYFQSKNIAFESAMAKSLNINIIKHIKTNTDIANHDLAVLRGACPDAWEHGVVVRCSHTLSIAPNASTSIIMGNISPSIEPLSYNVFRQDTESGTFINRNKYLEKVIINESTKYENGKEFIHEVWNSIIANEGSVQHLDWMDSHTKNVFKTAMEIDQRWIIDFAADRQKYVDQAQSVNTFFHPEVNIKYLHAVHFSAWKQGLKSLYYLRSKKLRRASNVTQELTRIRIEDSIDLKEVVNDTVCLACEG